MGWKVKMYLTAERAISAVVLVSQDIDETPIYSFAGREVYGAQIARKHFACKVSCIKMLRSLLDIGLVNAKALCEFSAFADEMQSLLAREGNPDQMMLVAMDHGEGFRYRIEPIVRQETWKEWSPKKAMASVGPQTLGELLHAKLSR